MPTFIRHVDVAASGGIDRTYLTFMDFLPTLLEVAGNNPVDEQTQWKLFDLEADPGERDNLPSRQPQLTAQLVASLLAYRDGIPAQ